MGSVIGKIGGVIDNPGVSSAQPSDSESKTTIPIPFKSKLLPMNEIPRKEGQVYLTYYHSYALGLKRMQPLPPPRFMVAEEKELILVLFQVFREYQHWTETELGCFPEFYPLVSINGEVVMIEFKPQHNAYWTTIQICGVTSSNFTEQIEKVISDIKNSQTFPLMPEVI